MAKEMGDRVESVVRALRLYHSAATDLDQEVAARAGLSPSDQRCVDLLDLHGGRMTAGRLAEAAHLTAGAITGVVDRLQRAGIARRVPDEQDRRRVLVELDRNGRDRGRATFAALVDAERAHLDALSERDLQVLHDFLEAEQRWVRERAARLREERSAEPPGRRAHF